MAVKTIHQAGTGRAFKLGRHRPVARGLRLSLKNYLWGALPAAPSASDYTIKPASFLAEILGNDVLGDCTAAAAFHVGGTFLANAGAPIPYTDADVISFYSATSGYVPGDESTDNGADEQTVLNFWQTKGLLSDGSHKLQGWLAVDGTNQNECRAAIYLFENIYFGIELPDAWVNPAPAASGFMWDVAGGPDPNNGHAFPGLGYGAAGITIDTWGMLGTVTWDAVARYASAAGQGELYAVLGADALAKATAKAPNGMDWDQLTADLASMKG